MWFHVGLCPLAAHSITSSIEQIAAAPFTHDQEESLKRVTEALLCHFTGISGFIPHYARSHNGASQIVCSTFLLCFVTFKVMLRAILLVLEWHVIVKRKALQEAGFLFLDYGCNAGTELT